MALNPGTTKAARQQCRLWSPNAAAASLLLTLRVTLAAPGQCPAAQPSRDDSEMALRAETSLRRALLEDEA